MSHVNSDFLCPKFPTSKIFSSVSDDIRYLIVDWQVEQAARKPSEKGLGFRVWGLVLLCLIADSCQHAEHVLNP